MPQMVFVTRGRSVCINMQIQHYQIIKFTLYSAVGRRTGRSRVCERAAVRREVLLFWESLATEFTVSTSKPI